MNARCISTARVNGARVSWMWTSFSTVSLMNLIQSCSAEKLSLLVPSAAADSTSII